MNFLRTPSFYNNEEYFNKYLGKTSYYIGLQNVVEKVISLAKPNTILEMGAALGTTTLSMANKFPNSRFVGTDIREDIVSTASDLCKNVSNISFFAADMCELAKQNLSSYDLIYLLYSFHHILDPISNKTTFLQNCYSNMRKGSLLLIAETFLPDGIPQLEKHASIHELFKLRAEEGYASTFWAALETLDTPNIELARQIADFSKSEESLAGENVYNRTDEYLVDFSWLIETASKCGFDIVIAEPVNALMEKAILLRK